MAQVDYRCSTLVLFAELWITLLEVTLKGVSFHERTLYGLLIAPGDSRRKSSFFPEEF